MDDFDNRNSWSQLRYSYYSAGRVEILLNNFHAGEMLLGYAVESALKQLLIEYNCCDSAILNSHDIPKIYNTCISIDAIKGTEVSIDFLNYISDHFLGRYPSLIKKALQKTYDQGMAMFQSCQILSWYDDFLFQLDNEIVNKTNHFAGSSFILGGFDSDNLKGRLFHHGNYHACRAVNETVKKMKDINPSDPVIPRLQRGIQYYWSVPHNFIDSQIIIQPQSFESVNVDVGFVKNFIGPKFQDKKSVAFTFSIQNQLPIGSLPW